VLESVVSVVLVDSVGSLVLVDAESVASVVLVASPVSVALVPCVLLALVTPLMIVSSSFPSPSPPQAAKTSTQAKPKAGATRSWFTRRS
jgi:hypothetical protein